MSDHNPLLRETILEVVDNQLRTGQPPETRQTLDRLMAAGYSREEARSLIGAAVVTEIWRVLHEQQPYDEARYVAALQRLPELPDDE